MEMKFANYFLVRVMLTPFAINREIGYAVDFQQKKTNKN